jgi:hypothetical protein
MRNRWKSAVRTAVALAALAACAAAAAAQEAPGRVAVAVLALDEPAAARIQVFRDRDDTPVAAGAAGEPIELPAGSWRIVATLEAAIDRPERGRHGVLVRSGETTALTINFNVARVTLRCLWNDDAEATGAVKLRRPGESEWLPEVPCGAPFLVSGGTYEAEARIAHPDGRTATVHVDRLQDVNGGVQALPVRVP